MAIAGALATMGCAAAGDVAYDVGPAGGSGGAAEGGAQEAAGESPVAGSAGAHVTSKAGAGSGGAAGTAGAISGASGRAGSASGGATSVVCNETKNWQTLGSCSYYVRVCVGAISIETDDGESFACDASGCNSANEKLTKYCVASAAGGTAGMSSGGAPSGGGGSANQAGAAAHQAGSGGSTQCSATDICCPATVAKVIATEGCYPGAPKDQSHQFGCTNPCTTADPKAVEAMCRQDDVPFCVWDSCWKCMY